MLQDDLEPNPYPASVGPARYLARNSVQSSRRLFPSLEPLLLPSIKLYLALVRLLETCVSSVRQHSETAEPFSQPRGAAFGSAQTWQLHDEATAMSKQCTTSRHPCESENSSTRGAPPER